jgi:hypothetical protein
VLFFRLFDLQEAKAVSNPNDPDDDESPSARRWAETGHHFLRSVGDALINHAFGSMSSTGEAGEAASLASNAAGAAGGSAAEGVGSLLEALPEVAAAALATGGRAGVQKYAKARAELEHIHRKLKAAEKKHVGKVSGADHTAHAGRTRRTAHAVGGGIGSAKPGWADSVDTSRLERR